MIHRNRGEITFECDGCDSLIETGDDDFGEAMAQFRSADWKAQKVGDEWLHLCPVCKSRPGR